MSEVIKFINASEFISDLKKENLVIVHRSVVDDAELELLREQKRIMKLDAATPKEIVRAKLLHPHLTTEHSIKATPKLLPGELFKNKNGKGQWVVCISAVKRLRKQFGYSNL